MKNYVELIFIIPGLILSLIHPFLHDYEFIVNPIISGSLGWSFGMYLRSLRQKEQIEFYKNIAAKMFDKIIFEEDMQKDGE